MSHNMENVVSGKLTDAEIKDMRDKISEIRKTLSFLVSLTPQDVQRLLKPSGEMLEASEQVAELMSANAKYFPKDLVDVAELKSDMALLKALMPVQKELASLCEAVEQTTYALKSDIFRATLKGYNIAQMVQRQVPGMETRVKSSKSSSIAKPAPKPRINKVYDLPAVVRLLLRFLPITNRPHICHS